MSVGKGTADSQMRTGAPAAALSLYPAEWPFLGPDAQPSPLFGLGKLPGATGAQVELLLLLPLHNFSYPGLSHEYPTQHCPVLGTVHSYFPPKFLCPWVPKLRNRPSFLLSVSTSASRTIYPEEETLYDLIQRGL